jgi:hypothetical protein
MTSFFSPPFRTMWPCPSVCIAIPQWHRVRSASNWVDKSIVLSNLDHQPLTTPNYTHTNCGSTHCQTLAMVFFFFLFFPISIQVSHEYTYISYIVCLYRIATPWKTLATNF